MKAKEHSSVVEHSSVGQSQRCFWKGGNQSIAWLADHRDSSRGEATINRCHFSSWSVVLHASEPRRVCCGTGIILQTCLLYVLCDYLLIWSTFFVVYCFGYSFVSPRGSGRLSPPVLVTTLTISHCPQPAETNNQVLEVLGCVGIGR